VCVAVKHRDSVINASFLSKGTVLKDLKFKEKTVRNFPLTSYNSYHHRSIWISR